MIFYILILIIAQRKSHIDKTAILQLGNDRGIRASTQIKSENAEKARKVKFQNKSRRALPRIAVKHKFTQKELLLDALNTEGQFLLIAFI